MFCLCGNLCLCCPWWLFMVICKTVFGILTVCWSIMIYTTVIKVCFGLLFAIFALFMFLKILVFRSRQKIKRKWKNKSAVVGFFHPYCNAGGGGERVLWCAVRSVKNRYPTAQCVVYTGDTETTPEGIIKKANETFGISLPQDVEFVFLKRRNWVEAKRYPVLTLLGQSLGSVYLGLEALLLCPPDIFIDTMGYAFTLPLFKYVAGCQTGCYVHYPTISTDMLGVVEGRSDAFNNRAIIARSKFLTSCKLLYYRIFAYSYGLAGRCSDTIMVNSSWTSGHVKELWKKESATCKVFPPCDIGGFLDIPLERNEGIQSAPYMILSIGQFRPEKNHSLQVIAFERFLSELNETEKQHYQLVLVGGCRNKGDEERVAALKLLANDLDITDNMQFKTNISFQELKNLLSRATVGIHTMANEHFGIGVVEFQAAGVIALANNSGGPKMDIVQEHDGQERTGFLADDVSSYSKALHKIFNLPQEEKMKIRERARLSCKRFSEEEFEEGFLNAVSPIMGEAKKQL